MARTRNWDNLTARQQSRYVSAGRSGKLSGEPFLSASQARAYYELGGDLRAARGHPLRSPGWSAPKKATTNESLRQATSEDEKSLRTWRESRKPPKWLPTSRAVMSDSTAAILSRLTKGPEKWVSVTVRPLPGGGGGFRMEVLMRGSTYPEVLVLPDWASVSEVGRLLNDHSRAEMARTLFQRKQLAGEWDKSHIKVSITGTETRAFDQTKKKLVAKKGPPALAKKGNSGRKATTSSRFGSATKKPATSLPTTSTGSTSARRASTTKRRATAQRVKQQVSGSGDAISRTKSRKKKK